MKIGKPTPTPPKCGNRWEEVHKAVEGLEVGLWLPIETEDVNSATSLLNAIKAKGGVIVMRRQNTVFVSKK